MIIDVFSAVQAASVAYGVVPFENSTNGSVVYTLDLLVDREDLFTSVIVCGETYMDVHHCLLGYTSRWSGLRAESTTSPDGAITPTNAVPNPRPPRARPMKDLRHIKRIYSHPQAFGQCQAFLSTYLKGVEQQEVSSTSKAAEMVAADRSKTTAAISSKLAADIHGLKMLSEGIEDSPDNTTRFLILQKKTEDDQPGETETLVDQRQPNEDPSPRSYKSLVTFTIITRAEPLQKRSQSLAITASILPVSIADPVGNIRGTTFSLSSSKVGKRKLVKERLMQP